MENLSAEKFDADKLKVLSEKIGISVTVLSAFGLGLYFILVTTVSSTLSFSVNFHATCTAIKK